MNSLDIVIEYDEAFAADISPDFSLTGVEAEDALHGLTIIEPEEEAPATAEQVSEHQEALARLCFDCRRCSDDGFAKLLSDGLDLLGRTEIDIVKMFAVRLERAESWTYGSEVPPPAMRAGLLQWLTKLAEIEFG